MFDLSGKCALITGASGGIGGAIAKALYERGAKVALSGTRKEVLEKLAAELGERAIPIVCDLSSSEGIGQLAKDAEAAMGSIDILVNNAGITKDTLMIRMKDEDWQKVIDVNLTANFKLTRAVVIGMMKRRKGRIVNITSVVGVTGNAGQVNYAASKAGLIGMTKSLAVEVASRGITANCIAPGFITTAMTDVLSEDVKNKMMAVIPTERFGRPEDIAAAVVFLASDEASYMTGQTLHVNGGMARI
jgi:3-oxoacyl-[acyl-carrier protein] reductase